MQKITIFFLLVLGSCDLVAKNKFGLHFDKAGKVIMPDREFLARGLDDDRRGFRKSAIENFKRSASYGNHYAMSLIGLYHLQDEAYVESLAWFKMLNLSTLKNRKKIEDIVYKLEKYLKKNDLKKVKVLKSELIETYSDDQTLLNRKEWLNNLEITGVNVKGHIPGYLTFNLMGAGQIMDPFNTSPINGYNVRDQIEEFIYEYDHNFSKGVKK